MFNGCDKNVKNIRMIVNEMRKTDEKAMQMFYGNLFNVAFNVVFDTDEDGSSRYE